MRLPNKLPFSRWRSMSGVRMSGTFSRKYPVRGCPFTRTPNSRRRSTQVQTADRETPISRATRAPLTTIVAFSASNVTSAAMRRSVVPGSDSAAFFLRGTMLCESIDMVLASMRVRKLTFPRSSPQVSSDLRLAASVEFVQARPKLLQFDLLLRERSFQSAHNLLRRATPECSVPELPLLRRDGLLQAFNFLAQTRRFRSGVDGFRYVSHAHIKQCRRAHRAAGLRQAFTAHLQLRKRSQPENPVTIGFNRLPCLLIGA